MISALDPSAWNQLGARVAARLRHTGAGGESFAEIAQAELATARLPESLDVAALAAWATAGGAPDQDPSSSFGDLSVIVHSAPEFVIQLLVWNHGVADIHQHAFSGAFRVLSGSSVHARYALHTVHEVTSLCRVVDASLDGLELLNCGDVRTILPGDGLTHGVFHLDAPTLSVVVRTRTEALARGPDLLVLPRLALNVFALDRDPQLQLLERALWTLHGLQHPQFVELLIERSRALDFAAACHVILRCYPAIGSHIDRLVRELTSVHGPLAGELRVLMEELERVDTLKRLRRQSRDSDQRFLLAALLYCQNRSQLEALLHARWPGRDTGSWLRSVRAELPPRLHQIMRALAA